MGWIISLYFGTPETTMTVMMRISGRESENILHPTYAGAQGYMYSSSSWTCVSSIRTLDATVRFGTCKTEYEQHLSPTWTSAVPTLIVPKGLGS